MYESLWGQVRIIGTDETFAFGTRIDDDAGAACGTGYVHGFGDGADEGFRGERLYDARSADDGDASHDAQTRVECTSGYFFTLRNRNTDIRMDGMQL